MGSDRTRDIHRNQVRPWPYPDRPNPHHHPQFVGAMSFLAWSKAESKAGDRNEEDTEGLANVVAVEPCVLYSWSFQVPPSLRGVTRTYAHLFATGAAGAHAGQ